MAEKIKYDQSVSIHSPVELKNTLQTNGMKWATQASELLHKLGGEHTFQPPPEKLAFALSIGHATVASSEYGDLAGYVKMAPWTVDAHDQNPVKKSVMAESQQDFEDIHTNCSVPVCLEIGSLVVDPAHQGKNVGKALVMQILEEGMKTYPHLPKIAVVTNDNAASLAVFNKLNWSKLSKEEAISLLGTDVLDGWDPPSTIFLYTEN
jgi:GNAT superfamily N-acetyltransferase